METSEVGYNFLIHANNFKPNKERDYLHKVKDNIELQLDVETNEELLKTAFQLVINKIKSDEKLDYWEICKIKFIEDDSNFEKELKELFVEEIKALKRFQINSEFEAIDSFEYFDDNILQKDIQTTKSIYSLLSQFRKLPPYDLYCEISKHVNNWNLYIKNKFKILTLENIGEIVNDEGGGHYLYIQNKEAYKIFIKEISINMKLFKV